MRSCGFYSYLSRIRRRRLSASHCRIEIEAARGLSPLVGREEEMNLLHTKWNRTAKGKGQFLLLNGEAGIGKSRMTESIKRHVKGLQKSMILELRCADYHTNSPFYPLIDLLENRLLGFEREETSESKVDKLGNWIDTVGIDKKPHLSIYADFLSIPMSDGLRNQYEDNLLVPAGKRKKFLEGFTTALFAYACKQPVLLIVEDLHWMDDSTLEWLTKMIEELEGCPTFVLCTTRPQFKPPWSSNNYISQLDLNRLSTNRIESICLHQTQGKTLPKEILEQIKDKTNDIPLFVEELTRMIIESDMLEEKETYYELKSSYQRGFALTVPSTLKDSLIARLDNLVTSKETAQIGAVLGREFSYKLLAKISQQNEELLEQDLAELVSAEFLYQKGIEKEATYIFKHALIQDTAYESLLKSKRRELHQKVAIVLDRHFPELVETQPELMAYHQTKAGLLIIAIQSWKKSAELARKQFANKEAINHLKQGLILSQQLRDKDEVLKQEFELYDLMGKCIFTELGFNHPELEQVNEQLMIRAQKLGRAKDILGNKLTLIFGQLVGGNYSVKGKLETLLTLSQVEKDDFMIAATHWAMGILSINTGNYLSAKTHFEEGIELYQPILHGNLKLFHGANIRMELGVSYLLVLHILGYPEKAKLQLSIIQKLANKYGNPHDLALVFIFSPHLYLSLKEYSISVSVAEEGLVLLKGNEDSWTYRLIQMLKKNGLAGRGDQEAALFAYEFFCILYQEGYKFYSGLNLSSLIEPFKPLDLPKKGLEIVEDALHKLELTGERFCLPNLYRLKGDFLLMIKESASEAEQLYLKAIDISKQQSAKWHELLASKSLARLWQSQGKIQEAYELLDGVYSWFTEGFDTIDMKKAKALLEELERSL